MTFRQKFKRNPKTGRGSRTREGKSYKLLIARPMHMAVCSCAACCQWRRQHRGEYLGPKRRKPKK